MKLLPVCTAALALTGLQAVPAAAHGAPARDLSTLDVTQAWPEVIRFGPEVKLTYGADAFAALAGGRGLLHLGDGPYIGTAGYIGARLTGPSSPAEIAYGGAVAGWEWRIGEATSLDAGILSGMIETPIAGLPAKELRVAIEPTAAFSWRLRPGIKAGLGFGYLYAFGPGAPAAFTGSARFEFKQLALLFPAD